jgi:hypothetical protein
MKKFIFCAWIMTAWAAPAWAELIQGEITAVDPQNRSVTVAPRQQTGKGPIQLTIQEDAMQRGQTLDQLSVGDEIIVEANKPLFGGWEAQSVIIPPQDKAAAQHGAVGNIPGTGSGPIPTAGPAADDYMSVGSPEAISENIYEMEGPQPEYFPTNTSQPFGDPMQSSGETLADTEDLQETAV